MAQRTASIMKAPTDKRPYSQVAQTTGAGVRGGANLDVSAATSKPGLKRGKTRRTVAKKKAAFDAEDEDDEAEQIKPAPAKPKFPAAAKKVWDDDDDDDAGQAVALPIIRAPSMARRPPSIAQAPAMRAPSTASAARAPSLAKLPEPAAVGDDDIPDFLRGVVDLDDSAPAKAT
jgi:hypothetical protein